MARNIAPISINERNHTIDIIRGLAIFGIFLVNMPAFNSPWLYLEEGVLWTDKLDLWTENFIDIFAQASYYTLFSFLFGFGMVIFKERAIAKGASFPKLFSRRLLILLMIGVIHAFLIWHGDILISYALIGFLLFFFHRFKPLALLIWALILIFLPNILVAGLLFFVLFLEPQDASFPFNDILVNQSLDVYSSGTFVEITVQRANDWLYVNNFDNGIFLILSILPMFLLGAFIAKNKWFTDVEQHLQSIKRMWLISFLFALLFKPLPYFTSDHVLTQYLQDSMGGPASAIFYATSIVLLVRHTFWKKWLFPFAAVGRLSLSNYLFQSLLATTLFYSYGFGLYGEVRPIFGFALTIVIYIGQIFLSQLWLRKFNYGPVEWLWRSLTYGKIQSIKKSR